MLIILQLSMTTLRVRRSVSRRVFEPIYDLSRMKFKSSSDSDGELDYWAKRQTFSGWKAK